jgi:4,5-DOPA dioxygenase extradiol
MAALLRSHGAPPLVDDERWVSELTRWARELARPQAILMVSAHSEAASLVVDGF